MVELTHIARPRIIGICTVIGFLGIFVHRLCQRVIRVITACRSQHEVFVDSGGTYDNGIDNTVRTSHNVSRHGLPVPGELCHTAYDGAVHDRSKLESVQHLGSAIYMTYQLCTALTSNEHRAMRSVRAASIFRHCFPHIRSDDTAGSEHLHAAVCTNDTAVRQSEELLNRSPAGFEKRDTDRYRSTNEARDRTPTVFP